MEEYKNILKLAKILDGKQLLATDDLTGFATDIVNAFAQVRATHKEVIQEHKDILNAALKQLNAEHDRILKEVENENDLAKREVQKQINTLLLEAEALKAEIFSMKPQDGKDGKDGVDGKDGKDGSPDTGEEIVDKINKQDKKIKAKNIEGLDKQIVQNTQHIISSGVNKIIAGSGITIDASQGNGKGDVTISASGGSGLGDVVGPASSTDNAIALYDGTTGKLIQNSSATIADDGTLTATSISAGGSAFTSLNINGTAGNGHVHLKHQSSDPSSQASSSTVFADSNGNLAWINNGLSKVTLDLDGVTSARTYTFQDASGTVAHTTQAVDYEVTDTTKGLILKSADGTRWRIGITNNGELTASSL